MEIEKIGEVKYEVKQDKALGMNSSVIVYATEPMFNKIKSDRTLGQAINATTLPGLAGNVLVMPDGHEGYGFPVGGVAAFDSEEGIISPGAVGYDINCGVKAIKTNLTEKEVRAKINVLADTLFKNIPSGVGSKINLGFTNSDLEKISEEGASYVVSKGFGNDDDVDCIEESGMMEGADFKGQQGSQIQGSPRAGNSGSGKPFPRGPEGREGT